MKPYELVARKDGSFQLSAVAGELIRSEDGNSFAQVINGRVVSTLSLDDIAFLPEEATAAPTHISAAKTAQGDKK